MALHTQRWYYLGEGRSYINTDAASGGSFAAVRAV